MEEPKVLLIEGFWLLLVDGRRPLRGLAEQIG
jgi:hypothetical protein